MDELSIHQDFPTYGGLSRVAMIWGVPIMALVGLTLGSIILILILSTFMGDVVYLLGLISFGALVFIKIQCATDDQAIRILSFELFWYFKKTNKVIWGENLTILPVKYGRSQHVIKRFYKQCV